MTECLVKQTEDCDNIDARYECDLPATSARPRPRVGLRLAGAVASVAMVCLCLRYWVLGIVTLSIAVGLFLLFYAVDDYAPQETRPGEQ